MSEQLLRKVPKPTSLNFIERRGIMRGMPCVIVKVEGRVISLLLLKQVELDFIMR